MTKRTNRVAWGTAAVLGMVLLGWASVPYAGQRLPFIRPHVWVRVPQAVVSLDGKPTACVVYRSYDGNLLLWMCPPFVLFPAGSAIQPVSTTLVDEDCDPHSCVHVFVCGRFALVMEDAYRPGCVLDNCEGAPHAIVHPGYVEFKPAGGWPRMRVKF